MEIQAYGMKKNIFFGKSGFLTYLNDFLQITFLKNKFFSCLVRKKNIANTRHKSPCKARAQRMLPFL